MHSLLLLLFPAALMTVATGQLVDPDLFDPVLDYDILPNIEAKDTPFTDNIPIHDDRDRRFLEGLVIEAGRHTMFPELYIPDSGASPYDERQIGPYDTRPTTDTVASIGMGPYDARQIGPYDTRPTTDNVANIGMGPYDTRLTDIVANGPTGIMESDPYDKAIVAKDESGPYDALFASEKRLSPRFFEMSGQPEIAQSYTNRATRRNGVECPKECPLYKPVCGSDGKVYQSECHLLKENCGSPNVSKGSWEKCHGKHYLCPSRCLDISDPVCATDGHIYHNVCIMRKNNCGKLLQVLPLKKCYGDMKQWRSDDSCPETCPEMPQPACGSDGVIYFNECFMRMRTCRTGIVSVEMENCVHIPRCPEVCLPIYDPVCGSDGKFYINQCRMLQQNCGKAMKKMAASFCSSDLRGSLSLGNRP